MSIRAKVVADSICGKRLRLVTVQVRTPTFIDAEIEKHRMLSSNSSSSRAVPFKSIVNSDFYLPEDVRLDKAGMQGDKKLSQQGLAKFQADLVDIRDYTITKIDRQWSYLHKQTINRYLSPFAYQDKIMTGTLDQFDAFFKLRLHPAAQPEIHLLAKLMKQAIGQSTPTERALDEWHLPYIFESERLSSRDAICASVARCARVSYLNHDQSVPDVNKDLDLHDKLLTLNHMSCFEHQALPMGKIKGSKLEDIKDQGTSHMDTAGNLWSANFRGWIQYRKLIA